MTNDSVVRYSDEDLQEFKALIEQKMSKATEELEFTRNQIEEINQSGFNQQNGDMYDDSSVHTDLEFMQRMATRQSKYIDDLQKALFRIQNKTYGVCIVTGDLIPKERLRLVPHATKSVDGKNIANASGKPSTGAEYSGNEDPFDQSANKTLGKPIGDKVRLPQNKRMSPGSDEWELDNESIENATFRPREDDEE